jgi:DNA-binding MarR family transcriptional regulator
MRIAQQFTACDAYAAHHATGKASAQCARILGFIAANRGMDWSIGEVAHFLSMEKSTVSARIRELLDADELEAKPNRKDRRSNITVRPVGLPVMGQMELIG